MHRYRTATRASLLGGIAALGVGTLSWPIVVQAQTVSADLSFRITCTEAGRSPSNESWAAFLNERGFRVLDKVRLARKLGQAVLLPRDLVAVDGQDRMVELSQMPIGTADEYVMLRSPPPTKHDENLEAALVSFATEGTACRAVEVSRRDNPAGAGGLHGKLVAMAKGWFKLDEGH